MFVRMIMEIKNNEIKIEHKVKKLSDVNVIKVSKGYVYLSSRLVDCIESNLTIDEIETALIDAEYNDFYKSDNMLINIENVKSMFIRHYQYAGISIYECNKNNSDLNIVNLVCKNGKNESIPFSTFKEAEAFYHDVDSAIIEYKSREITTGLI